MDRGYTLQGEPSGRAPILKKRWGADPYPNGLMFGSVYSTDEKMKQMGDERIYGLRLICLIR
ncbi:MAG: hypothetical protein AMJ91_00620 [candidate division Zixibacteria bacterium SM23_73_3]|nr:MAG: hypothetical protein AMJ91_00620 [candidate division Zixibacteria bacterium SM23_73_3]